MDERIRQERLRVSRDLHDDLGQILMALRLELDIARQALGPPWKGGEQRSGGSAVGRVRDCLARALGLADRAEQAMRDVVWALRLPQDVDGAMTGASLAQRLKADLTEWAVRERWVVDFTCDALTQGSAAQDRTAPGTGDGAGLPGLRPAQFDALIRSAQEALRNVASHGRAKRVSMRLGRQGDGWCLDVRDDGRGLTPTVSAGMWGLGLRGLAERLDALGGQLSMSNHELGGCQLTVRLPDVAATGEGPGAIET